MKLRLFLMTVSAALLLFVACGNDDDAAEDDTSGGAVPSATTSAGAMPSATMSASAMGSPTAGNGMEMDVDKDLAFIDGMIAHHQSAIDMAEVALEKTERPEIEQLSNDIITAQQAEIEQLTTWRDEWFPDTEQSMGMPGMSSTPGMNMSAEDMQMLRDADPFDKTFMEMMIEHHQSAIMMAEEIQKTTERPELQGLADAIITAQQAEIEQMTNWLAEWYGQ